MTVKELQTSSVKSCGQETDLATVVKMMWEGDCGAVPVIGEDQKVIGMITDRDICIASATRGKAPAELRAGEVLSSNGGVHACHPEDDVRVALRMMRKHRVRRLPVVDQQERLTGIVSINDLAIHTGPRNEVPSQDFMETLQAICQHSRA